MKLEGGRDPAPSARRASPFNRNGRLKRSHTAAVTGAASTPSGGRPATAPYLPATMASTSSRPGTGRGLECGSPLRRPCAIAAPHGDTHRLLSRPWPGSQGRAWDDGVRTAAARKRCEQGSAASDSGGPPFVLAFGRNDGRRRRVGEDRWAPRANAGGGPGLGAHPAPPPTGWGRAPEGAMASAFSSWRGRSNSVQSGAQRLADEAVPQSPSEAPAILIAAAGTTRGRLQRLASFCLT